MGSQKLRGPASEEDFQTLPISLCGTLLPFWGNNRAYPHVFILWFAFEVDRDGDRERNRQSPKQGTSM